MDVGPLGVGLTPLSLFMTNVACSSVLTTVAVAIAAIAAVVIVVVVDSDNEWFPGEIDLSPRLFAHTWET